MSLKLSGQGLPRGKFEWQEDHRLVVAWLHERFVLSMKDRATVFNTIFSDYLRQCGKPEGQNGSSLNSQYHDREKRAAQNNSWRDVYRPPRNPAHSQRRSELESLVIETIVKVTKRQPVKKSSAPAPARTAPSRLSTPPVQTPLGIAQIRAAAYVSPSQIPAKRRLASVQDLDDEEYSPVSRPASRLRLAPQHRSSRPLAGEPITMLPTDTLSHFVEPERAVPRKKERQLLGVFLPSAVANEPQMDSLTPSVTTPQRSTAKKPTSSRSRSRPRDLLPKFTVSREHGRDLEMTAQELERYNGPATPITVEGAFPPTPSLLFRYWDEASQGTNTEQGFVAGRFYKNNMPIKPAPHPKDLDLSDLYTHYSRDEIATPFISTSCFLMWIVRLAVKELHAGKKGGRISVIDPRQLPPRSFYFSRPCHQATLYKMPYTKGQHMYGGACEFLVWHRIPQAAVMHSFSVIDLVRHTHDHAAFGSIMQLPTLTLPRTVYMTRIRRIMKAANKTLTPQNIGAVAEIVHITGLDHRSSVSHVSHIIGDTLRGLAFVIERHTEAEWQQKSSMFAHAMAKKSDEPLTLKEQESLKLAFLNGVVWSFGGWTWSDRMRQMRLMPGRAKKIGLASPAEVLAKELDAAKLHLAVSEQRQQRAFPTHRAQALLEDGVEDDEEQEALTFDVESLVLQSNQQTQQRHRVHAETFEEIEDSEDEEYASESEQILYE